MADIQVKLTYYELLTIVHSFSTSVIQPNTVFVQAVTSLTKLSVHKTKGIIIKIVQKTRLYKKHGSLLAEVLSGNLCWPRSENRLWKDVGWREPIWLFRIPPSLASLSATKFLLQTYIWSSLVYTVKLPLPSAKVLYSIDNNTFSSY